MFKKNYSYCIITPRKVQLKVYYNVVKAYWIENCLYQMKYILPKLCLFSNDSKHYSLVLFKHVLKTKTLNLEHTNAELFCLK